MKKSWIAKMIILSMIVSIAMSHYSTSISFAVSSPALDIASNVIGGEVISGSTVFEVGTTGTVNYAITPSGGIATNLGRKPANVVMVLDTSGSMNALIAGTTKTRLDALKEASVNFLKHLRTNGVVGDKVTIISFSSGVAVPVDYSFSNKTDSYADAILRINGDGADNKGLVADGGTNYDKALSEANTHLAKSNSDSKTVLFFTDGSPTNYTGHELYEKIPKSITKTPYLRHVRDAEGNITATYTHVEAQFDVYHLKNSKWGKGTGTTTLWIEGDKRGEINPDYRTWNQANSQEWRPSEITGWIQSDLPALKNLYRWDNGMINEIAFDMPAYSKVPITQISSLGSRTSNPASPKNQIWYNPTQDAAKGGVTYLNAEFDVFKFSNGQLQKGRATTTLYQFGNYMASPLWDTNAPEKWFENAEVKSKWLQSGRLEYKKSAIEWNNQTGVNGEPRGDSLFKWDVAGGAEQDIPIIVKWYEYLAGTGNTTSAMEKQKAKDAADRLEAAGITVHTVSFGGDANQDSLMQELKSADGQALTSSSASSLNDSFNLVAESITKKHLQNITLTGKLPSNMVIDTSALIVKNGVNYVDAECKKEITFNASTGEYTISIPNLPFEPDQGAPSSFDVKLPFKIVGQGAESITTKLAYNDIVELLVEKINTTGSITGKSLTAPTFVADKTAPTKDDVKVTISYDGTSEKRYYKKVLENEKADDVAYILADVTAPVVTVNTNKTKIYAYSTYGSIKSPVNSYTVNNIDRSITVSIDTVFDSDTKVTGKTKSNAKVVLTVDGKVYPEVTAGESGTYTVNLTVPAVVEKIVKAKATDTAGNVGETSITVSAGDRSIKSTSGNHKLTTNQQGKFIAKVEFNRSMENSAPIIISVKRTGGALNAFTSKGNAVAIATVDGVVVEQYTMNIMRNATDGSFTLTPTAPMKPGRYEMKLVFNTNGTSLGSYIMSVDGTTATAPKLSVLVIRNPNIK